MPTEIKSEELYEQSQPFLSVYPDYDCSKLPTWVRENLAQARVYGNSRKGVILPDGRKYHLDNTLNDMTGREWTFFINSVFSTHYPTRGKESYAHSIRKVHPTPKPPQLMRDLISFFTKEKEIVFDAFAGVGGTLIGAALCNRRAFGMELNADYISAYRQAAAELQCNEYPVIWGDSIAMLESGEKILEQIKDEKISLMLIDPPYSNMMSRAKTGADVPVYGKESTPFTDDHRDLGNMPREEFLCALKKAVSFTLPHMKKRGYVVVFIKDLQPSGKEINLLHGEVIRKLNEIPDLYYKGMKIWADESAKIYPYGYPFSFVANQIHQYILVFRKEK